jgi:hypothetical protein
MNFYLLDSKNPIPWVSTYKSLYYRELQNAGNQCQYIMPTELADLRESDFVIFGHYREFLESKKYHKRYKSIMLFLAIRYNNPLKLFTSFFS